MIDPIKKLLKHPLIRYLAAASFIVVLELIIFQLIYIWDKNYVVGTVVSFAFAVVLNWVLSRKVVFGASEHHPAKEFMYVSIVSIVGLGIQLGVGYICVNKLHVYPLIGKIISIFTSFFWNYWFRAHFIFDKSEPSHDEKIERIDTSIY